MPIENCSKLKLRLGDYSKNGGSRSAWNMANYLLSTPRNCQIDVAKLNRENVGALNDVIT